MSACPWGGSRIAVQPAVADVNGNDKPDLIVTYSSPQGWWVEAISGKSTQLLWRMELPRKLFDMPETQSPNYDVSADAQRFLVWQREQGSDAPPTTIIFVENWFQECAGRE